MMKNHVLFSVLLCLILMESVSTIVPPDDDMPQYVVSKHCINALVINNFLILLKPPFFLIVFSPQIMRLTISNDDFEWQLLIGLFQRNEDFSAG